MIALTPCQSKTLEAVKAEILAGNVPTLQRIADRLSIRAPSTIFRSLEKLERRGVIRRLPGVTGGIEVLAK